MKLPRYRTGDDALDAEVAALVDRVSDSTDADLIFELVASALRLARDGADRGDLKIANAALKEMRHAFHVFAPYRAARKVAIFGSARTQPEDPLYRQTRDLAAALADLDWMVVTGAGPGIMEAGIEGAGAEHAFGVSILLPFETTTSQFMADDPKLINFRYFFTRKLEFMKESDAFVLLPGGYGTLDEAFELLTLLQTGKAQSAPVIMLDVPGGTYWQHWGSFVERELERPGYVSREDDHLFYVTDDVQSTVDEILGFYRNYDSQRFVKGRLVLRMQTAPSPERLKALNAEFADIVVRGEMEVIEATPDEVADNDHVDLARIAFRFDRHHWSRLRMLIDCLNERCDP
ncbi:MAG TPA: TIGR00730 family Rossman fold protein [Acidimicrobiia bacterium]|nr:TIGR00730 family Rossman fold protein [Acidimicrobiia bacterium]